MTNSLGNRRVIPLFLLVLCILYGFLIVSGRTLPLVLFIGLIIISFFLYQKPQYFLPLYFVFYATRQFGLSWKAGGGNIFPGDFLIVVILVIIILKKTIGKEKSNRAPCDLPIFLLFLLSMVLLARGIFLNGYQALREFGIFAFVLLYFITRETLREFPHVVSAFKWYFVFSVVVFISCVWSLYQSIAEGEFLSLSRLNWIFMGADRGLILLFTAIFVVILGKKLLLPNLIKIAVVFSYLTIIILSQVRTTYVALGASGIFTFLFVKKKKTKLLVAGVGVLLLIFLGLKFTLPSHLFQRLCLSIQSPLMYRTDPTSQWRIIAWQHEINRSLSNMEYFLIGRPLGSYYDIIVAGAVVPTHNSYLDFFSKTGLIGICLLLWFIVSVYKYLVPGIRNRRYGIFILAVLVCFTALLVHLFACPGLYQRGTGIFIGILSGIGLDLMLIAEHESPKKPKSILS